MKICNMYSNYSYAYHLILETFPEIFWLSTIPRLSYSGPGIYKKYCYPEKKAFCELGTRFKASHVKSLLWWTALRTHKAATEFPLEPVSTLVYFCVQYWCCCFSTSMYSIGFQSSLHGGLPRMMCFKFLPTACGPSTGLWRFLMLALCCFQGATPRKQVWWCNITWERTSFWPQVIKQRLWFSTCVPSATISIILECRYDCGGSTQICFTILKKSLG